MPAKKGKIDHAFRASGSLLASFVVILCGLVSMTLLASFGESDPTGAMAAIMIIACLLIAFVVLCARPGNPTPWKRDVARSNIWAVLQVCFRRPRKREIRRKHWKRKSTDFVPQPFGYGSDESVFVHERYSKDGCEK